MNKSALKIMNKSALKRSFLSCSNHQYSEPTCDATPFICLEVITAYDRFVYIVAIFRNFFDRMPVSIPFYVGT